MPADGKRPDEVPPLIAPPPEDMIAPSPNVSARGDSVKAQQQGVALGAPAEGGEQLQGAGADDAPGAMPGVISSPMSSGANLPSLAPLSQPSAAGEGNDDAKGKQFPEWVQQAEEETLAEKKRALADAKAAKKRAEKERENALRVVMGERWADLIALWRTMNREDGTDFTRKEFEASLKELGIEAEPKTRKRVWRRLDKAKSNRVDYNTFSERLGAWVHGPKLAAEMKAQGTLSHTQTPVPRNLEPPPDEAPADAGGDSQPQEANSQPQEAKEDKPKVAVLFDVDLPGGVKLRRGDPPASGAESVEALTAERARVKADFTAVKKQLKQAKQDLTSASAKEEAELQQRVLDLDAKLKALKKDHHDLRARIKRAKALEKAAAAAGPPETKGASQEAPVAVAGDERAGDASQEAAAQQEDAAQPGAAGPGESAGEAAEEQKKREHSESGDKVEAERRSETEGKSKADADADADVDVADPVEQEVAQKEADEGESNAFKETLELRLQSAYDLKLPAFPPPLDRRRPYIYARVLLCKKGQKPSFEFDQPILYGRPKEGSKSILVPTHKIDMDKNAMKGSVRIVLLCKDPLGAEDHEIGTVELRRGDVQLKSGDRALDVEPRGKLQVHTALSDHAWKWTDLDLPDFREDTERLHRAKKKLRSRPLVYPDTKDAKARSIWQAEARDLKANMLNIGTLSVEEAIKEQEERTREYQSVVDAEVGQQHGVFEKLANDELKAKTAVVDLRNLNKSIISARENKLMESVRVRAKREQENERRVLDALHEDVKAIGGVVESGWFDEVKQGEDERQSAKRAANNGIPRVRYFRSMWEGAPTVLVIRMDELRAIKDKLPSGRFVMMCSLWNRLGGEPIKYTGQTLSLKEWSGCTRYPQRHQGRHFDVSLSFGQKRNAIYIAVPPKVYARPGMCLVFELIQLRGRNSKVDKVVGWGAFPAFSSDFEPIEGRFKFAMLRGDVDQHIDRYAMVTDLISDDLDHWLCNAYFAVKRIQKFQGMEEETIQIEEIKEGEADLEMGDGGDAKAGADSKRDAVLNNQALGRTRTSLLRPAPKLTSATAGGDEGGSPQQSVSENPSDAPHVGLLAGTDANSEQVGGMIAATAADEKHDGGEDSKLGDFDQSDDDIVEGGDAGGGKATAAAEAKAGQGGTGANLPLLRLVLGEPRKINVTTLLTKVDMAQELQGTDSNKDGRDDATGKLLFEHTLGLDGGTRVPHKKHMKELKTYKMSVAKSSADVVKTKQRMLWERFREDLIFKDITSWRWTKFTLTWLFALFVRVLVHYVGQWIVIKALNVSVYTFNYKFYTIDLTYNTDILPPLYEAGIIAAGPISCAVLFGVLLSALILCRLLVGWYPIWISYMMLTYGAATLADMFIVAIIDVVTGNTNNGDAFKLYQYYNGEEGNGLTGLFLTIVVYAVCFIFIVLLYYFYILFVHKAGRILDLHARLFRTEEQLVIPNDLEISLRTLRWVIDMAGKYTKSDGTVRKVFTKRYKVRDHMSILYREDTMHVMIFDVNLSGNRTLYRQFVRLEDGQCFEVFEAIPCRITQDVHTFKDQINKRNKLIKGAGGEEEKKAGSGQAGGFRIVIN